ADDHSYALLHLDTAASPGTQFMLVRTGDNGRRVSLDGSGMRATTSRTPEGFAEAALSPDGAWVAYTIIGDNGMMRILRAPTHSL
ncbi:MAG: hypothetical protein AB8H86_14745, partial [Polyangiales bacterium]